MQKKRLSNIFTDIFINRNVTSAAWRGVSPSGCFCVTIVMVHILVPYAVYFVLTDYRSSLIKSECI